MKIPSINLILNNAKETFKRFPLVILNNILATSIAITITELEAENIKGYEFLIKILFCLGLGFPLILSLNLFSQRRKYKKLKKFYLEIGGIIFLLIYYFLLPESLENSPNSHFIRFFLLTFSFTSAVTFAPFVIKGELNGFWHYLKLLLIRLITAFAYIIPLHLGIIISMASIHHLFDFHFYGRRYFEVWVILVGVLSTFILLSNFPKNFSSLNREKIFPKFLKLFTQYVLLPITTVYGAILCSYSVKILLEGEWPKGLISYMIVFFAALGISTCTLLFPLSKNKWVRVFRSIFYFILLLLSGMLFWAIKMRISEYGFTENRYLLLALGFWILGLSIYFLVSKRKNIKIIFISVFFVVILSSFGPWGAINVSKVNQVARLKEALIKNDILINGQVKNIHGKEVPPKDRVRISGILDYLDDVHGLRVIQTWFREDLEKLKDSKDKEFDCWNDKPCLVMRKIMGIEYENSWKRREVLREEKNTKKNVDEIKSANFSIKRNDRNKAYNTSGFDYFSNFYLHYKKENPPESTDLSPEELSEEVDGLAKAPLAVPILENTKEGFIYLEEQKYTFKVDENLNFNLEAEGENKISLNLKNFFDSLESEYSETLDRDKIPREKMLLANENENMKLKILLEDIFLVKKKEIFDSMDLNGKIMIKLKASNEE